MSKTKNAPPSDFTDFDAVHTWVVSSINKAAGTEIVRRRVGGLEGIETLSKNEDDNTFLLDLVVLAPANRRYRLYPNAKPPKLERVKVSARCRDGYRIYKFKEDGSFNAEAIVAFIESYQKQALETHARVQKAESAKENAEKTFAEVLVHLAQNKGVKMEGYDNQCAKLANGFEVHFKAGFGGFRVERIAFDIKDEPLSVLDAVS